MDPNFIYELDIYYFCIIYRVLVSFNKNCSGRDRLETKNSDELEKAAILKWSFDMRQYFSLFIKKFVHLKSIARV